jgi:hypothetical protein
MDLICYACSQPVTERRGKIVDVEDDQTDKCWGVCHVCSIVVCSEHGFRNSNPVEYECVYCVGPGFTKRKKREGTPEDPSPAPETLETFTEAISKLKASVLEPVREAVIMYLVENGHELTDPLDAGAYASAANAYAFATGDTRTKERVMRGRLEEV